MPVTTVSPVPDMICERFAGPSHVSFAIPFGISPSFLRRSKDGLDGQTIKHLTPIPLSE